jgi:hypothetical protein
LELLTFQLSTLGLEFAHFSAYRGSGAGVTRSTDFLGTGQISRGTPLGVSAGCSACRFPTIWGQVEWSNVWRIPSMRIEQSNLPIFDLSPLRKSTGDLLRALGTGQMGQMLGFIDLSRFINEPSEQRGPLWGRVNRSISRFFLSSFVNRKALTVPRGSTLKQSKIKRSRDQESDHQTEQKAAKVAEKLRNEIFTNPRVSLR